MEKPSEFPEDYLPTLDFATKFEKETNQIRYRFFVKGMRTTWVIPPTSAMEEETLLSNDLVRRFSRVHDSIFEKEKIKIVDDYNYKVKWSGYKKDARQKIVEAGIAAYKERRYRMKGRIHRSAIETQSKRMDKKLLAKTTWYKE